ncbi:MAG: putative sulfate exporter family transporter, partial [Gammaproteobacteria bacterium]
MSPALNHGLAAILLIGLIAFAPPAIALIVGAGYALVLGREGLAFNVSATSKWCLQTAIVLLGFNIAIAEVAKTGSLYFAVGAAYIGIAALLGVTLARLFFISGTDRTLITSGTAICGGTA